jgi:hypothetical protein
MQVLGLSSKISKQIKLKNGRKITGHFFLDPQEFSGKTISL